MGSAAHVSLRQLGKRFGDGPSVLDGIDLEVEEGALVSLIGPSGCGKTTLLRLLAGLTGVTAGELLIDGKSPGAARGEMAYIFQEANLLPWLRVRPNVELALKLRGVLDRAERRAIAARMLDLVGLTEVHDRFPRELSGGMQMRVSIARALSLAPRLLLLDEPFGALDEMTRDRLDEELLAIRARENWTAFFVTHSVAEAVFLSTRIVVLATDPGRIATTIDVPFPFPRTAELRETAVFHDLVRATSRALRSVLR